MLSPLVIGLEWKRNAIALKEMQPSKGRRMGEEWHTTFVLLHEETTEPLIGEI